MTTREQLAPILAEFRSIFGAKATEVKWLADKIAALSPPEPTEGLRKAMLAFEDFLNEPPAYEEMLRVREYRHEAYREWLKLRGQITAALSLQDHGWRPISTAPKDWTAILLFNSRHPSHPPVVGRFATEPGEPHWCDAATLNGEALYFNSNYFDFWQPTPASPVILAEDGAKP